MSASTSSERPLGLTFEIQRVEGGGRVVFGVYLKDALNDDVLVGIGDDEREAWAQAGRVLAVFSALAKHNARPALAC